MSTRSTIKFVKKCNGKETPIVNIYQQFDGYLEGVGIELAKWLCKKELVNGLTNYSDWSEANGCSDLAAQYIAVFKREPGDLYITSFNDIEEYNYTVIIDEDLTGSLDKLAQVVVTDYANEVIFKGSPIDLIKYIEEHKDDD